MILTLSLLVNFFFFVNWAHEKLSSKKIKQFYNLHDLEKDDLIIVDASRQEIKVRVISNNPNLRTVVLRALDKDNDTIDGVWSYDAKLFSDRWDVMKENYDNND